MATVLVVEDQLPLARMLGHNLELEGYAVRIAGTGATALEACRAGGVDLVLLDLMIPYPDGISLLRTLREEHNEVPVIVLTAKSDSADKLRGLRLGADDYITKPFDLIELLARVAAVLRRSLRPATDRAGDSVISLGNVRIELETRAVFREGRLVHLRPKEYELLLALVRRRGSLARRSDLITEVWGYHPSVVSRTLDTHLAELRRKLEPDPANPTLIVTVRKAGFRIGSDR
ncbi:MAG: response regulator transcription factor [Gemmatimonadales bacterium]